MTGDPFLRMTPLELAGGWVPGYEPKKSEPGSDHPSQEPIAVLEHVLLDALQQPPCFIEFSGGRDSSAVLAISVGVAHREGLPMPIPITRFFPDAPESDEGEWPELVVNHLGLSDWVKLEIHDELDLLGPLAAEGLRRHGVLWPVTIHTKVLTFEQAKGGTLISGEGGDEAFGPRRITPLSKILAGARPRRRGIKPVVAALSPRRVRRLTVARAMRQKTHRSWLQPAAQEAFVALLIDEALDEPLWWSTSIRSLLRRRGWIMGRHNMSALAALHKVRYLQPLVDERFVMAFSNQRRVLGFPSRTNSMEAMFGHVLPSAVLGRSTKATFIQAYVQRYSRAFIEAWTGTGINQEMVDERELRKAWEAPSPHAASLLLLQQAWLAQTVEGTPTNAAETSPGHPPNELSW